MICHGGTSMDAITNLLTRNVTNVIIREDLEERLRSGNKLRIKLGIDPTGPLLHIGRAIPLRKMREFQDLGHTAVIIIGDFTGLVGDASDKDAERVMLTREQVERNMSGYLEQMGRILDMERTEVTYNSEWLATMTFEEIARLADNFSVAEMLDRENFYKRYTDGKRISLREFLYPLMQGYDSVAVHADVELGGNDQLFNLLAGRTIQKAYGQIPQNIMTFGMLDGLDGRKMSTTYGNYIAIAEDPEEQFGKVMRLKDELILTYFELCTDLSLDEIAKIRDEMGTGTNPMEVKLKLAEEIVAMFHGREKAGSSRDRFLTIFRKREIPDDIPTIHVESGVWQLPALVSEAGLSPSRSEAGRLIRQGGVKIEGKKITDVNHSITVGANPVLLQVGRRRIANIVGSSDRVVD